MPVHPTLRAVLVSGALVASIPGCENCPDREVELAAEPTTIDRSSTSTVTITFPDPVFVEEPPAREADVNVELFEPSGATVGSWTGQVPATYDGAVTRVSISDERTIQVDVTLAADAPSGTYSLFIVGDRAGACDGRHGTVAVLAM